MKYITRSIFVIGLSFLASRAHAKVDRQVWLESIYQYLPEVIQVLVTSKQIDDAEVIEYLKEIQTFYNSTQKPPLVFVDDSQQFIIEPGTPARLMRAPEGHDQPIFVNRADLNRDGLKLDLPQLIKLYLHELGHKTRLKDVESRDRWAQMIESLIRRYYSETETGSGIRIEVLSLTKDVLQVPSATKTPWAVRPTFMVFAHDSTQIQDLTPRLLEGIREKSMLFRNLSSDINAMLLGVVDSFKETFRTQVAPVFDQLMEGFAEAFGASTPKGGFGDALNKIEGSLQYVSAYDIQKATSLGNVLILDGELMFFNSHDKTSKVQLNGLPFQQVQTQPIQIKLNLRSSAKDSQAIEVQPQVAMDYSKTANIKSVKRESGEIVSVDVEISADSEPYDVQLILHFGGGEIHLRGSFPVLVKPGVYRVSYTFSEPAAKLGEWAYSVLVDSRRLMPLDRELQLRNPENQAPGFRQLNMRAAGLWGIQNQTMHFKSTFSHLQPPLLFPPVIKNPDQFILQPDGFWVEVEVEEDAEIVDGEMFVSIEQFILDAREKDKEGKILRHYDMVTVDERVGSNKVTQRYTNGGYVIESGVLKMSLPLIAEHLKMIPSNIKGFKRVRIPTATAIPHLRELKEPFEAHKVPNIIPHSVRVTSRDGRSATYSFSSENSPNEESKSNPLCADLLEK